MKDTLCLRHQKSFKNGLSRKYLDITEYPEPNNYLDYCEEMFDVSSLFKELYKLFQVNKSWVKLCNRTNLNSNNEANSKTPSSTPSRPVKKKTQD